MKLKKVEIEGFRAYKTKSEGTFDFTLDGTKPSDFVVVYAPNGFGKSSLYDAIEWAFTGNLGRYILDHNRPNNELAARSTKQLDVPQNILRNNNVDENITTSVNIETTGESYFRDLGKIRKNSRDFKFHKSDTEEGTEFFRDVILSQETIDRFLREVKPQERYKIFMENFGGNTEKTRQEITVLLQANENILNELGKKIKEIKAQLSEPLDESIFSDFNAVANNLNGDGESITLVSNDFSLSTEHALVSSIISRIHELESSYHDSSTAKETLVKYSAEAASVEEALVSISVLKLQLSKLSKGVKDAGRYQELIGIHQKSLTDLQASNQNLDYLKNIKVGSTQYKLSLAEKAAELDSQSELSKTIVERESTLQTLDLSLRQYVDNQTIDSQRRAFLRPLLNESESIFSNIAQHKALIASYKDELLDIEDKSDTKRVKRGRAVDAINKLSNIRVDLAAILQQDISILNLSNEILGNIRSIDQQFKELELKDQSMRRTQQALTQQVGLIERLIALGLEQVSTSPTKTCPLCQVEHPSAEELKSAIENNVLVSDLANDKARELDELTSLRQNLGRRLDLVLTEVSSKKNQLIFGAQQELSSLDLAIADLGKQKFVIQDKVSAAQAHLDTCQKRVWSLEKQDFVSRVTAELNSIDERSEEVQKLLNIEALKIEEIKKEIAYLNSKLSKSQLKVKGIESQVSYVQVQEYLNIHSVSILELEVFLSGSLGNVVQEISLLEKRRDQASIDAMFLKSEMVKDETWIDFSLLTQQQLNVSNKLKDQNHIVNSFFESIDKSLEQTVPRNIDHVRGLVKNEIDEIIKKCKCFRSKINRFNLLSEQIKAFKPYVLNLTLGESLLNLEKEHSQHKGVKELLSKELDVIISSLSVRIEAFFYTDLINSIYSKIDPHPFFKKVVFAPDFGPIDAPQLNIFITDDKGEVISPNLYFSAAQLNILSVSIFLAKALHAKDNKGDSLDMILIDDPIQSMDSINILAMIDLLRNISVKFDKQIILSTHDENFFNLLKRKIPSDIMGSKFLTLQSYGVVAQS